MDGVSIILPADFKRPKYYDGLWLDQRTRWADEDLRLLAAACDMKIGYSMAANSIGRSPTTLVHKALELGLNVQRAWRDLIRRPREKKAPKVTLQYPYIVKPDDKYNDLIAVNRIVSRQLPGREDVCQDIMLALWESRTSLEELKNDPKAVRAFVKSFRKASFERSGYAESMDATIHSDGGDGRSKYEDARYQRTLANPDDQFLESALFDRGYERNFSDDLIDEIDKEEQSIRVPAAFWMRAELT